MVASILIIASSLVLLAYWFRYSCILLLRNSAEQRADHVAIDPRFGFIQLQHRLQTDGELDPLQRALDRDFVLLRYLVEHAAGLQFEAVEDRLLMLDYRVMRLWYRLTHAGAPVQARRALVEMAAVLDILVRHMTERAGVTTEA